jgi:peptide/nickel transport system substrate-binding protein
MDEATESDKVNSTRRKLLMAMGGTATVALAGCTGGGGDDGDNDTGNGSDNDTGNGGDGNGGDGNGGDGTGNGDDGTDRGPSNLEVGPPQADKAQAAWERVTNNAAPEDQDLRNEAYVEMEEAVRDDMVLLPLYHGLTERFWYNDVDTPNTGTLGPHHQIHNDTSVEGSDTLSLTNSTFNTIDPIQSDDTASSEVINQMYETLTHYPAGVPELQNRLIEEANVSDDQLTWTLTLRDDVTFHDGSQLTAADVKYSIERVALSDNSVRASFALDSTGGVALEHETSEENGTGPANAVPDSLGLNVVDDQTLEINISVPNPPILDVLTYSAFAPIPEGYVGDVPGYDGEVSVDQINSQQANGTGPFLFDSFTENEEARVTRNDDYWGETASVEEVHWRIFSDNQAEYDYSVREENADIFNIPTQFYSQDQIDAEQDDRGRDVGTYQLQDGPQTEVNYLGVPELSTFYFAFNAAQTPKSVRMAVALVANHQQLVQQIFQGRGVEAFSFTPPGIWPTGTDGYDNWLDAWPYGRNQSNFDAAERILSNNGYTADDPYNLTVTTYSSETFQQAAGNLRDKLSGLGVSLELEQAPFSTLQERGENGDLQMYSLGWIWSWESVAYGLFSFEPKNTNTSKIPGEANGYYLDWQTLLEDEA